MNSLTAVNILLGLMVQQQKIATVLRTAQSEGRDVTNEELDTLLADYDASSAALGAEIDAAKAAGG